VAPFKDIALPLASLGLSVIPVQPRAKAPLVGALGRSKDAAMIEAWDIEYPDANVGIVSDDNFTILETDDLEAFREAFEIDTGRDLPDTLALSSGRPNRCAFIYRRTSACGNECLEVPGMFEFRNRNQYVVGPGSIHPDGHTYKWLNPGTPILEMPDWVVGALKKLDDQYAGRGGGAHVATAPAAKLRELYLKKLDPEDMISSGIRISTNERHYTLLTIAGLLHDGKRSPEDIAAILFKLRDSLCDDPSSKGDSEIYRLAEYVYKRDPYTPTKITVGTTKPYSISFAQPRLEPKPFQYVLNPKNKFDGWFMRGSAHLIAGSSGAGKTTLMLDLLDRQSRGEEIFGHKTNRWTYLAVMADRGNFANQETCARMGIDPSTVPVEFLSVCTDAAAVQKITEAVEKRGVPAILFIEGADGLVEDPNKTQVVAPFLSALGQLAEHYHMSIILSVGAGKQKKEGYAYQRDKVFGSQMWPRMTGTVIFMSPTGDGTGPERVVSIQHRNAATEHYNLTFEGGGGRLILKAAPPKAADPFVLWAESQPTEWTIAEAIAGMRGVLGKSAIYDRIPVLLKEGFITQDPSGKKFRVKAEA
jgi:hypothetical protein